MDIESRIKKLNLKMQEYIEQGRSIGFFTDENIERVVSRLEKVNIITDSTIPGDAITMPNRDEGTITIRVNENYIKNQIENNNKKYFEDEVLYHEFTHVVNGIYEDWMEKGDAFKFKKNYLKEFEKDDYIDNHDLITEHMSSEEKEKFNSYVNNKELNLAGYGWGVLDEFVTQTIAQKMVKNKYNDKSIYTIKSHVSDISEPEYNFYSDLADYEIFTPFAIKFIESLYGTKNVELFCKEALEENFAERIFNKYKERPEGLEHLYKMLGYLGNIYLADSAKKGHLPEEKLNQRDPDGFTRNGKNIYESINKFMDIADKEVENINNIKSEEKINNNEEVTKSTQNESNEQSSINKKDTSGIEDNKNKKRKEEGLENTNNEFSSKIQEKHTELNKLIKEMTMDYLNKDYKRVMENNKNIDEIIRIIADLKVNNSKKEVTKLDKMMEIRRLDAAVSNVILASRDHFHNIKANYSTDRSKSDLDYALDNFKKVLDSDIELQNELENKKYNIERTTSANDNKNPKKGIDIDKIESKNDKENKLKIVYSAQQGQYIIENTDKHINAVILKSKKDKNQYIEDNFVEEDREYIFGKNYKKALKKCDLQLIVLLSDIDMDYAKQYVNGMVSKSTDTKLPYLMTYDMSDINNNDSLSFFDKLKLRRLAKNNKDFATIIEKSEIENTDKKQIKDTSTKTEEEKYREELSKSAKTDRKTLVESKNTSKDEKENIPTNSDGENR